MPHILSVILREIRIQLKSKSFYLVALLSPLLFLIPVLVSIFIIEKKEGKKTAPHSTIIGILAPQLLFSDTLIWAGLRLVSLPASVKDSLNHKSFALSPYLSIIDLLPDTDTIAAKPALRAWVSEDKLPLFNRHKETLSYFIQQTQVLRKKQQPLLNKSFLEKIPPLPRLHPHLYTTDNTNKKDKKKSASFIAYILGIVFYMSLLIFNTSIIKSVQEERQNKLAEVLSLFVRPFYIITGKILGLSSTTLLQILLSLLAYALYFTALSQYIAYTHPDEPMPSLSAFFQSEIFQSLSLLPFIALVLVFLLLGTFLNGAFTTLLLFILKGQNNNTIGFWSNLLHMLAFYCTLFAVTQPDAVFVTTLSYIPFFSYLLIPTLLTYGLSITHIVLSALLLLLTAGILLLIAGKIYRKSLNH